VGLWKGKCLDINGSGDRELRGIERSTWKKMAIFMCYLNDHHVLKLIGTTVLVLNKDQVGC